MIGILAEKPSAARNMAKAFGGMSGTYNGEQYVIVAARGHLYEMQDPEKQVDPSIASKYHSWKVENLPWNERDFKWKYRKQKDAADALDAIKAALSSCDEVCTATDDDPSGEGTLLADEILMSLSLRPQKWSRMFFEDEAVPSLQKAFRDRKFFARLEDDPDYTKAFYRARWDFMSMQFTRIATAFGDGTSVLRQGRLKSAMVLIVGDQLKLCSEYKKTPYYQNRFKDENGVVYTDPKEPQLPNKDSVGTSKYHTSDVVCDSKEMKATPPPKLMDLAGLASILVSKGYKAKHVTEVYQKMYESQVVSYPRTEDKTITPEQFNDLLPLVDDIARVVGVDPGLLTHRVPRSTHVKAGGAHGANRPGPNVPKSLDALASYGDCAADIYEILAKNYLAMLAEDYEYESQKGHVKDFPTFKGSASVPKKPGWKAVFNDTDFDDIDENAAGLGTTADPFVYEGFPTPPATPTMKWLMKQLEKRDVGTGATRTSTYADVTSTTHKYPLMKDTKGKISMTDFGNMSYLLLPGTNIGSLDMTERLHMQMREVGEGKLDPEACLHEIQQMVLEDIETMKKNGETMRQMLGVRQSSSMAEKYSGSFGGRDVSFKRVWNGYRFSDEECEKLLNGEQIEIEVKSQRTGNNYFVTGDLADQVYKNDKGKEIKYIGFRKLSQRGDGPVADAAERYSGTWNGKEVSFKRVWSGHTFTDDECRKLCAGEDIEIDSVSAKTGKAFKCHGILAEQDFKGHSFVGFKNLGFVNDSSKSGGGSIPDEWCKHKFTSEELSMLQAGMGVYADDFVSRKGSKFSAKVFYGMQENGRMGFKFDFDSK